MLCVGPLFNRVDNLLAGAVVFSVRIPRVLAVQLAQQRGPGQVGGALTGGGHLHGVFVGFHRRRADQVDFAAGLRIDLDAASALQKGRKRGQVSILFV